MRAQVRAEARKRVIMKRMWWREGVERMWVRVCRRLLFGAVAVRRRESRRSGDGGGGDFSSWDISS